MQIISGLRKKKNLKETLANDVCVYSSEARLQASRIKKYLNVTSPTSNTIKKDHIMQMEGLDFAPYFQTNGINSFYLRDKGLYH